MSLSVLVMASLSSMRCAPSSTPGWDGFSTISNLRIDDSLLSTAGHFPAMRDDFAKFDSQHRDSTPQRVHRLTAEAIVATMNNHPEETTLIRREAAKKRRHRSVPPALGESTPRSLCAPPLLDHVSHPGSRIDPGGPASVRRSDLRWRLPRFLPPEAIGSLARAPQAVDRGRQPSASPDFVLRAAVRAMMTRSRRTAICR